MVISLNDDAIAALREPGTTKVLATSDEKGLPHITFTPDLQIDERGRVLHPEPFQGSQTNRNLLYGLWFNRPVAILVQSAGGRSWSISGTPVKAEVCGPVFRRHYEAWRQRNGDIDLAAVWVIEPQASTEETGLIARQQEQDRVHPFFRHLDRLIAGSKAP